MSLSDLHRPFWFGAWRGAVKWLILVTSGMFLAQQFSDPWLMRWFALTPRLVIEHGFLWQSVSYLFLHGGLFHWLLNMYIVWAFGTPLLERWGNQKFLRYYLVTGGGAGVCTVLLAPHSGVPTIGASGAIFGLLVAFAMEFPHATVYLYGLIPFYAWQMAVLFGLIELLASLAGTMGGVARFAHLGGLIAGYLYLIGARGLAPWARWALSVLDRTRAALRRRRPPLDSARGRPSPTLEQEVDRILDKILHQGVQSLTAREHEMMRRYSQSKQ
ncbi:MAG: rhomboid family intramembrane serine protease [Elusimicrobia bacterium]|nr:rhomboid family intramembrane serine protease [Elusimicrobiota bacterium]